MIERITCLILAILLAPTLGGCAAQTIVVSAPPAEKLDALVERSAGTVGVYYPPEFRNYVGVQMLTEFYGRQNIAQISLGEPSRLMIERSMQGLFRNVVQLADWPMKKPMAPDVELVVVPRIELFSASRALDTESHNVALVRIGYGMSVYAPSGDELANWSLVGSARVAITVSNIFSARFLEQAIGAALRDASAQLLAKLAVHPVIAERFKPETLVLSSEMPAAETQAGIRLVVISPRNPSKAPEGVACLERALTDADQHTSLVPGATFRDSVFPWFEPSIAPEDHPQMSELLKRRLVARRLKELGVRHLIVPALTTVAPELSGPFLCGGGMGAGGCFGVATATRESRITVQVWNVATSNPAMEPLSAESKGTSWVAGFLVPVWRTAPTEAEACANVVRQLAPVLAR